MIVARWSSVAACLLSVSFLAPLGGQSSIDDIENQRLQVDDYKTLCLLVDELIASENRTTLSTATVRNRTEVRLRSAGIQPLDVLTNLTRCTDDRLQNGRYLQVSVRFQGNTFKASVDFIRRVAWWVSPDPDDIRSGSAPTRQEVAFGTHNGRIATILDALDTMLDQFLNAYVKANQK